MQKYWVMPHETLLNHSSCGPSPISTANESPWTPHTISVSSSLPKHTDSPSCLSKSTHLGNPKPIYSSVDPDLSHFLPSHSFHGPI